MWARTRRLATVALTIVVALILSACGPSSSETSTTSESGNESATTEGSGDETATTVESGDGAADTVLRVAIPDDVETLDPAFGQAVLTNTVLKNTYLQPIQYEAGPVQDGEFAYADTTSFEGQSVESWSFSDDRRTLTLELREGLTFPETGNPVTADDFIWTIERALGTQAGPAWVWGNLGVTSIDQVEKVDDFTVVVSDARPSAIMEPLMRDQTLGLLDSVEVSSHATEDDPWSLTWLSQNYAGNGRYLVSEWQSGTSMTLTANPEWPGEQPFFQTIELTVVPESSNRLALLQNGDVDIALDLSAEELAQAESSADATVLSVPDRAALNVGMNMRAAPFDDVRVRQALSYAVDYNAIVEGVLQGRADPSQGPISVHSRFFDLYELGELWEYEYSVDEASRLLEEAGYGDGFSFELIVPQGLPYVEATAANLKANFAEVGVDMTIVPVNSATMAERLAQRDFDAFLRGYLTDYVDDPYYHFFLWWGTDTVLNWVGYSNETVDQALEDTAELVDDESRKDAYVAAIGQVIDDAPMLWLANADFTLAIGSDIKGYVHHPDQLLFFAPMYRE